MQTPTVAWQPKGGLAEIYSVGLEYTLLSPDFKGLTKPIMCKDFFTDLFYSEKTGKEVSIYGFHWKKGLGNYSKDPLMMALRFKEQDLSANAANLQSFLNEWETHLGLPLSVVDVDSTGKTLIVKFNEAWTTQPIRISMFTLLLRIGLTYDGRGILAFIEKIANEGTAFGSNDKGYVRGAMDKFKLMLETRSIPYKQTYEQYTETYNLHNNSGILNHKE